LPSSLVGLKAVVESEDVGGPLEAKTLADVDVEISRELEEEEDLVRFEDIISGNSCTTNSLEAPRFRRNVSELNRNESFSFYLIQKVMLMRPQHQLSSESLETKYSFELQMLISIVHLEFEDFY